MDNNTPNDFARFPPQLLIHQDWEPILSICKNLIKRAEADIVPGERITLSDFHGAGQVKRVTYEGSNGPWHLVSGKWLYKYLPWLKKMEDDLQSIEPNFTITISFADIGQHTDSTSWPCALNYPLFTTNAETYLKYDNEEYTYPSIINQPWILNTQLPHGVRNPEKYRACFTVHFAKDYNTVKSWFDAHPNLVYGE